MVGKQRSDGASIGAPDATGRSSGRMTGRAAKIFRPPTDQPWTWLTMELLESEAWRRQSVHSFRLISFLMAEHQNHAARENGHLMATYDQLEEWGIGRQYIREAIEEASFLGLIKHLAGGRYASTNQPSTFRLTFFADRDGAPATNEWKATTEEVCRAWSEQRRFLRMQTRDRRLSKKKPNLVMLHGN